MRTTPGAPRVVREARDGQKVDLHRDGQFARQRGQEEDRAFQNADQLQVAVAVVLARSRRPPRRIAVADLFLGEQHAFDDRADGVVHELATAFCSASPYLKIRSCRSFW